MAGDVQSASKKSLQSSVSVWLESRMQTRVWVLFPLGFHSPQSCPVE